MDHKDLCNHTRIKLIASAIGHQQCTKTEANIIPLPGTDRVIAIGTPAEVLGLLGMPLTAPAPLTDLHSAIMNIPCKRADHEFMNAEHRMPYKNGHRDARHAAAELALSVEAAPAPQQSESISTTEFQALAGTWCGASQSCDQWTRTEGARQAWAALVAHIDNHHAKAAPAAPVQRIPDILTVETIQGAIAFGRMGINPPPSPDHWGNEFWQIGRQLAKLSETSAWDNVTPVDVAAPVQADQAQAEPVDQGHVLRTLRRLLDGSQPQDIPGAVMVIDNALKDGIAWSYDIAPPQGFIAYVKANYTGDVHFHDPEWHATRLWNAAMKNAGSRIALPAQAEQEAAVRAADFDAIRATIDVLDAFGNLPGSMMHPGPWSGRKAEDKIKAAREALANIRALRAQSTATSNDTAAQGEKGDDRE